MLTPDFRKALATKAHTLSPVVRIGQKGLTDTVHTEIEAALKAHELIKVKVSEAEASSRLKLIDEIKSKHQANIIQTIGHIAVFYRINQAKHPVAPKKTKKKRPLYRQKSTEAAPKRKGRMPPHREWRTEPAPPRGQRSNSQLHREQHTGTEAATRDGQHITYREWRPERSAPTRSGQSAYQGARRTDSSAPARSSQSAYQGARRTDSSAPTRSGTSPYRANRTEGATPKRKSAPLFRAKRATIAPKKRRPAVSKKRG